ncbi:protein phosphatase CheZ [Jeongeupia naejangsanensis]|uniref:Protein phosphatase CheZ n=1 Tax=Jeongeupia naejangsanensis TaxID=613195 RepID=A0ABS2BHZ9_9NEIS|nr:protein phosphatase CheZ [Jeongeupia naejangsanensis]MBM3115217.1 protein phosphatase CheZ [Jeongeupia naejangsanensis]
MSDHANNNADNADLEALFDSIAQSNWNSAPTPATTSETAQAPGQAEEIQAEPAKAMFSHIGQLTRKLHDTLRELGLDKSLEKAASQIPNARDRLSYIATMTEQAADRTLNALDAAKPLQDRIAGEARSLSGEWDRLLANKLSVDEFKALVLQTRQHLGQTQTDSEQVSSQMLEIMMAQDFQDLTGQVIKKVLDMAKDMEAQLLDFLVMFSQQHGKLEENGLLNGPVINSEGRTDVVTNQQQVDDLLESLGF